MQERASSLRIKSVLGLGWWCIPVIPAMWEVEVEGLRSKSSPGQNVRPLFEK
jgi:hypothetical protein